jgi:RNA recognition motif-containing protein
MSAFSSNWRQPASAAAAGPGDASKQAGRDNSASGPIDAAITEGRRLYVGNLDYNLQANDIESFFGSTGFQPVNVHVSVDRSREGDGNPGYCFVEFGTKEEADRALQELQGVEMSGRNLKVGPCTPKRADGQARYRVAGQDRERPASYSSHWGSRGANDGNGTERQGYRTWRDRQGDGNAQAGSSSRPSSGWRTDSGRDSRGAESYKRSIHVGGLPKQENTAELEAALRELFKDYPV